MHAPARIKHEIESMIIEGIIDIMFITETWLREKGDEPLVNEITPRNYLAYS